MKKPARTSDPGREPGGALPWCGGAKTGAESAGHLSDVGVLAAAVAHELRNPLAAISMAAANLRRKASGEDLEKHFVNIEKKVLESNQIISNLLSYSRLKPPRFETVRLNELLDESIRITGLKCKNRIRMTKKGETLAKAEVTADPSQLKEVFANILDNACDAAAQRRKGAITVRAEDAAGNIKVIVRDSGPGISREVLARLFTPFFTTKAKGTGLGLYICRRIMKFHNGDVSIESAPGKGTKVTISLPKEVKHDEKTDTDHR